jgi:hypothetical protein
MAMNKKRLLTVTMSLVLAVLLPNVIVTNLGRVTDVEAQTDFTFSSPYFEYSPATPRVGDSVTFDASDFDAYWQENNGSRITGYNWSFGDGTSATGVTVTHVFDEPDTYLVQLSSPAESGLGCTTGHEVIVREQTPVSVYVLLNNDRPFVGQEVTVTGNLTCNGVGVPGESILLSGDLNTNPGWNDITLLSTNALGAFSAAWTPTGMGQYEIKASWAGNITYPETASSVLLITKPFGDLITGFSSNSTVNRMNFNLSTAELTFSVEGPSGTCGHVRITLEDDPQFDPQNIRVLLDEQPIQYDVEASSQTWILDFTYTHSVHDVVVNLKSSLPVEPTPSSSPTIEPTSTPKQPGFLGTNLPLEYGCALVAIAFVAVVVGSSLIILRRHKKA